MSTYRVHKDPNAYWYDVIERTTDGDQRINKEPLNRQEARELAATCEWAKLLDTWMVTVVEDEDTIEEVGEILGLGDSVPMYSGDDEAISKAYDHMIGQALKFLPAGLRRLADLYEEEWNRRMTSSV